MGEKKDRKKPVRRALHVFVPMDINQADELAAANEKTPGPAADGTVEAFKLPSQYHYYHVPGGTGQKDAVRAVLAKHSIDVTNVGRVRVFIGEKPFQITTQTIIRF